MKPIQTAALVCCSNGLDPTARPKIQALQALLQQKGIRTLCGSLYAGETIFSAPAPQRAAELMQFYRDPAVDVIFDVSGGDLANQILPLLDYSVIAAAGKPFWGYSDLTTVLNAIYTKTGCSSALYQVHNLTGSCAEEQQTRFAAFLQGDSAPLFTFPYRFIRGKQARGVLVGGNIRCLLKLAGTPYFPPVEGRILLLEARSGTVPQMTAYLSQLSQMGVLDAAAGLVLGTFSQMELEHCLPDMEELVLSCTRPDLPVIKTREIGHAANSRGAMIGGFYSF